MKKSRTVLSAIFLTLLSIGLLTGAARAQFSEVAKILASDAEPSDWFGYSVSVSGDRAIVGTPSVFSFGVWTDGAAYIFERDGGGVWSEVAKIQASDAEPSDRFGESVSISGDRAIVGAQWESTGGNVAGAAYIFERSPGGVWSEAAKIQASDKEAIDVFGSSVSISGERAIVGATGEDTGGADAGAAYIFERSGGVWSEVAKIQASDKEGNDRFGKSVSISGDRAIVGAFWEDTGGSNAGAAYVFERGSGGVWSEAAKIQASDKEASDWFGESVSISGDRAIAGAIWEDTGGNGAGAAYIFERSPGVWSEVAKIQASDIEALAHFGGEVSISGDRAIIGGSSTDAAYIFERSFGGVWSETAKIQASDIEAGDNFGVSVSISGDDIIVGANGEDTGGLQAGAAYIFEAPSITDVLTQQCAAVQALIDDPATPADAIDPLEDAKAALEDALEHAGEDETKKMLQAMRDAAEALEEAREEMEGTDPIASALADLARKIATDKKDEVLACDPNPTGNVEKELGKGDSDLADGDEEYNEGYFGDAIKDYRKAWEDYCKALDHCAGSPKTVNSEQYTVNSSQITVHNFALHQNYPNPFNPTTQIRFALPEAASVTLEIYNMLGQKVRTLISGEMQAGFHTMQWDARNDLGQQAVSGVYLYRLQAGSQVRIRRMTLMK